ncbi:hypothetical protein M3223_05775 [Paenibacillus pasadenensis]|uniref:hypothetical protein n=1 Tax=Paenibacillus pasadenensis TaxID=217090 RepID=UPI00203CC0ED|nr:hypothetical protein [Paenibacillus pasadenensis]MCM3746861.1 hypothetical protein [Paenibacillus pasadenensis]
MKSKAPAKKQLKRPIKKQATSGTMQLKLNNLLKKQVRMSQKTAGTRQGRSLIRSTGVLKKNPSTDTANVDIMNRGDSEISVNVLIISWDSDNPETIGNISDIIPSNSFRSFNTSLIDVAERYEIIIFLSSASNVVINHFGTFDNVPQIGNIVLDRDFVGVRL